MKAAAAEGAGLGNTGNTGGWPTLAFLARVGTTAARNHGHELDSKCTRRSHSGFVIEVCAERHSSVLKIKEPASGVCGSHLYKKRKGGPPVKLFQLYFRR
jgi:hypothetical protein